MATRTKVDELYVSAGVDTKTLDAGLREFERKTQTSMQKAAGSFKQVDDSVGKLEQKLFSLRNLAVAGLVVGLGAMIARTLNALDAIQDMSEAAGLSIERFQELHFAFRFAGVSQEAFASGMARFAKNVGEAEEGNDALVQTFRRIGVSIYDVNGNLRSQDAILNDVIGGVSQLKTQAERSAAAYQLFGREVGSKFAATVAQGTDAIDALVKRAREMNLVIDEDTVKAAAKASDELEILGEVIKTQLSVALAQAAPVIADVASWLSTIVASLGKLGQMSTPEILREIAGWQGRMWGAPPDLTDEAKRFREEFIKRTGRDIFVYGGRGDQEIRIPIPESMRAPSWDEGMDLGWQVPPAGSPDDMLSDKDRAAAKRAADKLASDIAKRQKELNDAWAEDIEAMRREIDADYQRVIEQRIGNRPELERRKADARAAYEQGMDELRQRQIELEKEHLQKVQDAWGSAFQSIGDNIIAVLSDSSMKGSDKMKAILLNALYQVATAFASTLAGDGKSPAQGLGGIVGTAIAGWIGGGSGGSTGGGGVGFGASPMPKFAAGGIPPVGRISWVGERGPEPFVPAVSGRILSHEDAMQAVGRAANGNGGGDTYIIDARGADKAGLAHLEAMIVRLNGSIEHRARAVMHDDFGRNRGVARQAR